MTRTLWPAAVALGVVLAGPGAAPAQTPKQVQKAEVLLQAARVLKTAWVWLELANGTYKGTGPRPWRSCGRPA